MPPRLTDAAKHSFSPCASVTGECLSSILKPLSDIGASFWSLGRWQGPTWISAHGSISSFCAFQFNNGGPWIRNNWFWTLPSLYAPPPGFLATGPGSYRPSADSQPYPTWNPPLFGQVLSLTAGAPPADWSHVLAVAVGAGQSSLS